MKKQIIILLTMTLSLNLAAQKFEGITAELLAQERHPLDSTAHASIVTQDIKIKYDFNNQSGITQIMEYHYVIKVYDDQGEEFGEFEIPYYENGGTREKIRHIKAFTANLVNGKVVKTKLDKKDIFEEKTSKNWEKKIFALPEVRAGSVFEVKYEKTSPYIYSIPNWYFQHEIPTDESIFQIDVPSYFTLTPVPSGSHPLESSKESVNFSKHGETRFTLTARNLEAVKEDKYVLNENDYRAGIKYEILSTQFPGKPIENYSKDWNKIASNLMDAKYFGKQIKKKLGDSGPVITAAKKLSAEERMPYIYNYVRENYAWNDKYGKGAYDGLKKVVKEKSGSVGEINLLLQNLLLQSGVKSYPMVMKSRSGGILNTSFPTLTELDYVVVYVPTETGYLLLDASSKLSPIGQLPVRAINMFGVVVKEDMGEVVTLQNPNIYKIQTVSEYTIDIENNQLNGTSQRRRDGYASTKYRFDQQNKESEKQENDDEDQGESGEDEQNEDIESFDLENTYTVTKLENLDNIYEPIKLNYEEQLNTCSKIVGDKIFIDAALDFGIDKNPFDEETRDYPVFFNYKIARKCIVKLTIPDGYTLESAPEAINAALPERKGKFNYNVKPQGNFLMVTYIFDLKDTLFGPSEYPALKMLYNMMVKLNKEKIVLTKV